ncbi:MAG: hypothetical protein ACI9J5_000504, partial [Paraglaciecola sp.]
RDSDGDFICHKNVPFIVEWRDTYGLVLTNSLAKFLRPVAIC